MTAGGGGGRGLNFLAALAEQMRAAADRLDRGNEYQRAWAGHLRTDRGALVLMANTWREPERIEH